MLANERYLVIKKLQINKELSIANQLKRQLDPFGQSFGLSDGIIVFIKFTM